MQNPSNGSFQANFQTLYSIYKKLERDGGDVAVANIESESPNCHKTETRKSQNFKFLAFTHTVGKGQRVCVYNEIRLWLGLHRGVAVMHCCNISIPIQPQPLRMQPIKC